MTYLLDTNICSAYMRRPGLLAHKFMQYSGRMAIPTIVLAELLAGAYKHPNAPRVLGLVRDLRKEVSLLTFDALCAEQYGMLYGALAQMGLVVDVPDLMIAAVAIKNNLILVTNNSADFKNIPGLHLEDWLTP